MPLLKTLSNERRSFYSKFLTSISLRISWLKVKIRAIQHKFKQSIFAQKTIKTEPSSKHDQHGFYETTPIEQEKITTIRGKLINDVPDSVKNEAPWLLTCTDIGKYLIIDTEMNRYVKQIYARTSRYPAVSSYSQYRRQYCSDVDKARSLASWT